MKSRILVAVPGIAVTIGLVVAGGIPFAVVVALIAVLGLLELRSLLAEYRPLRWASDLGAAACVLLPLVGGDPARQVLTGCAVVLGASVVGGLIAVNREEISLRVGMTAMCGLYLGLPLGCLVAMRELPQGASAVANVLVGTWAFDTFSYFGGRTWGKRPIAPVTSPNKTVEGAAIGLLGAILAMVIAGLYIDWLAWWESVALGVAICVAAFAGDLFESMLKRDAGVKDSGRLLGGHGGVLDRFDALLMSAPVCYLITLFFLS